jgi:hypothetical protein
MASPSSNPPEDVNSPPAAGVSSQQPDDMIDTPEEFAKWPFLHDVLRDCRDTLVSLYIHADEQAMHAQQVHRRWVVGAAGLATLAVFFAIVQLTIHKSPGAFAILEGCAVAGALVAFHRGDRSRQQWLLHRHKAERCRLLKFGSVIQPETWTTAGASAAEASESLGNFVETLQKLSFDDVQRWSDDETISLPPTSSTVAGDALAALRDYYLGKRLRHQVDYFQQQYERNIQRDRFWRRVPVWLFAGSVMIVALHVAIEAILYLSKRAAEPWQGYLDLIVGFAVLLPAIAAGIRTWRSAHETTRNISRFRAKHLALSNIQHRMETLTLHDAADVVALLRDLWCAEQIMETEHREWLRLMLEAEWLG